MNICTEFGIWLRTLSSSSSGGVASRLAMRKPVMDSSLQSWCVASPFGRTFLHNLCRHYLSEQEKHADKDLSALTAHERLELAQWALANPDAGASLSESEKKDYETLLNMSP